MMRKVASVFVIVFVLVALASCSEKKAAESQGQTNDRVDSLQRVIAQKDNELNDMVSTFNEIQEGFQQIEADESKMTLLKSGEQSASNTQQIHQSLLNIQQHMQHNRELIAKLQKMVREGSNRSDALHKTIDNFVKELENKNVELQKLRSELEQKDIHIAELDKTVEGLNGDVTTLKAQAKDNQETISNQDKALNTAFYVFGNKKELQNQNIYHKGRVLQSNFNKSYFTKIDIREVKEIKLYSKSAEMLTSHPAGSYTLQQDAQKKYILRITNPQVFWSASKYLVILVK